MSEPVQIGDIMKDIFYGYIPTSETVKKAFEIHQSVLPVYGSCKEKERTMAVEVHAAISRAIAGNRMPKKEELCAVCPRWECPEKKGTVDMNKVDNHK